MAVGFPQTATEVNARAGQLAMTTRDTFVQVKNFKAWLDGVSDAVLGAPPFSIATGDIATLRSAYADLAKLADIYNGAATQGTAYDFKTFAKFLTGVL